MSGIWAVVGGAAVRGASSALGGAGGVDGVGDEGGLRVQLATPHEPGEVGSGSRTPALALQLFHPAGRQVSLLRVSQKSDTFGGI